MHINHDVVKVRGTSMHSVFRFPSSGYVSQYFFGTKAILINRVNLHLNSKYFFFSADNHYWLFHRSEH